MNALQELTARWKRELLGSGLVTPLQLADLEEKALAEYPGTSAEYRVVFDPATHAALALKELYVDTIHPLVGLPHFPPDQVDEELRAIGEHPVLPWHIDATRQLRAASRKYQAAAE